MEQLFPHVAHQRVGLMFFFVFCFPLFRVHLLLGAGWFPHVLVGSISIKGWRRSIPSPFFPWQWDSPSRDPPSVPGSIPSFSFLRFPPFPMGFVQVSRLLAPSIDPSIAASGSANVSIDREGPASEAHERHVGTLRPCHHRLLAGRTPVRARGSVLGSGSDRNAWRSS